MPSPSAPSDLLRQPLPEWSLFHGVRNRAWRGLQFNAHYTFSKAIDELSDAFNADARHGEVRPQNPYNIRLDRGRADFAVRHRFVTGFTYEAPFFKGNRWLGGWVASVIIQLQSGVPFTVYHAGQDPNADGFNSDRASSWAPTRAASTRTGAPRTVSSTLRCSRAWSPAPTVLARWPPAAPATG